VREGGLSANPQLTLTVSAAEVETLLPCPRSALRNGALAAAAPPELVVLRPAAGSGAIGGFNGTDPAPTLAQFERDVTAKAVHYFIAGGAGPGNASTGDTAGQMTAWVESHFTATTLDGVSVYDLTSPT